MPRPTSRGELLEAATTQFEKLDALLGSMSADELRAPMDLGADTSRKEAHWRRDKCVRDVLVHLYEWHNLLLVWVAANLREQAQPFLPPPYNWSTYGQLNEEFWRKHQSTSLEESKHLLRSSHEQVMALIARFTDAELFEKKHFSWTGNTTLGSYCVSATASHYAWALKKLRLHQRNLRSGKH